MQRSLSIRHGTVTESVNPFVLEFEIFDKWISLIAMIYLQMKYT